MLCALMYRKNGDLANLLKSARKKVPQSARLSAGRGVQSLFGQCPNAFVSNFVGASLIHNSQLIWQRFGRFRSGRGYGVSQSVTKLGIELLGHLKMRKQYENRENKNEKTI